MEVGGSWTLRTRLRDQMTHNYLGKKNEQNWLIEGGVPKDPDRRCHVLEEGSRMTPALPNFVRPAALHLPTFCWMLSGPRVFYNITCLKKRIRSPWQKFAPSYNPFFCVVQIPIRVTTRITKNTKRFSPITEFVLVWLFNAKHIFIHINSSISKNSVQYKYSFVYILLNVKIVLFQTIQFTISAQFKPQNSLVSINSV